VHRPGPTNNNGVVIQAGKTGWPTEFTSPTRWLRRDHHPEIAHPYRSRRDHDRSHHPAKLLIPNVLGLLGDPKADIKVQGVIEPQTMALYYSVVHLS
jgi:hypothetical protein